jgi:hypothetical protein
VHTQSNPPTPILIVREGGENLNLTLSSTIDAFDETDQQVFATMIANYFDRVMIGNRTYSIKLPEVLSCP